VTGLAGRWAAAAGRWGASPDELERTGAALVARYAEPHRRYHTVAHLRAVLGHLFVDLADDPVGVSLAAWYHDAVYDAPDDRDGAVVCDADLAILGSGGEAYARYCAAVREEFGWLTADEWRAGRSAVLARLLDRPRLYATARGRARWERRARANLAGERARLLAQP